MENPEQRLQAIESKLDQIIKFLGINDPPKQKRLTKDQKFRQQIRLKLLKIK